MLRIPEKARKEWPERLLGIIVFDQGTVLGLLRAVLNQRRTDHFIGGEKGFLQLATRYPLRDCPLTRTTELVFCCGTDSAQMCHPKIMIHFRPKR